MQLRRLIVGLLMCAASFAHAEKVIFEFDDEQVQKLAHQALKNAFPNKEVDNFVLQNPGRYFVNCRNEQGCISEELGASCSLRLTFIDQAASSSKEVMSDGRCFNELRLVGYNVRVFEGGDTVVEATPFETLSMVECDEQQ